MGKSVLVVNASVQGDDSMSRSLVKRVVEELQARGQVAVVRERDLSKNGPGLLTQEHVEGFYTESHLRTASQHERLHESDALVDELKWADILVIGAPMYNFSVPASLKAWIDLVCRAGETFRYTDNGPIGLLSTETAYLVVATGGTAVGSEADFLTPYLRQVMRFLGVQRVEVIAADGLNRDRERVVQGAIEQIKAA